MFESASLLPSPLVRSIVEERNHRGRKELLDLGRLWRLSVLVSAFTCLVDLAGSHCVVVLTLKPWP